MTEPKIEITSTEQTGEKVYIFVVGIYTIIPRTKSYEYEAMLEVTRWDNIGSETAEVYSIEWPTGECPPDDGSLTAAEDAIKKFIINKYEIEGLL